MAEKAKKVNPFLQAKLAEFGKTEVDVITEQVTAFLEQGEIDINSQITHRTVSVIPTLNLDLTNAKKALAKAQKALAKAETEVPSNYRLETYLETLYSAETAVEKESAKVESVEAEIEKTEKEVAKLKVILERFKA